MIPNIKNLEMVSQPSILNTKYSLIINFNTRPSGLVPFFLYSLNNFPNLIIFCVIADYWWFY